MIGNFPGKNNAESHLVVTSQGHPAAPAVPPRTSPVFDKRLYLDSHLATTLEFDLHWANNVRLRRQRTSEAAE
jgi:hypothetical protein